MGVAFAFLLDGKLPWPVDQGPKAVRGAILAGKYQIDRKLPPTIQDLIARMIVVDPDARATAAELKQMPWYKLPAEPQMQPADHANMKLVRLASVGPLMGSQQRAFMRSRCVVPCKTFSERAAPVPVGGSRNRLHTSA
jgi:serine/threonine protein kinase